MKSAMNIAICAEQKEHPANCQEFSKEKQNQNFLLIICDANAERLTQKKAYSVKCAENS